MWRRREIERGIEPTVSRWTCAVVDGGEVTGEERVGGEESGSGGRGGRRELELMLGLEFVRLLLYPHFLIIMADL